MTNETAANHRGRLRQNRPRRHARGRERSRPLRASPSSTADALDKLENADAIIIIGAQPSRDHGVLAARIRTAVRKRGAKLLIFHARKSDLDQLRPHLRQRRQPGAHSSGNRWRRRSPACNARPLCTARTP